MKDVQLLMLERRETTKIRRPGSVLPPRPELEERCACGGGGPRTLRQRQPCTTTTRNASTSLVAIAVLLLLSAHTSEMMRSVAAWSTTSSKSLSSRRLLSSGPLSGPCGWSSSSTSTTSSNNKWTMMCTDSRELRFRSGSSSSISTAGLRPAASSVASRKRSNNNLQHSNGSSKTNLLLDLSQTAYSQVFSMASATQQHAPEFLSNVSAMASSMMSAQAASEEQQQGNVATLKKPFFTGSTTTRSFTTLHGLGNQFEQSPRTATSSSTSTSESRATLSRMAAATSNHRPPQTGYGPSIRLTDEERDLFQLLRRVRIETGLATTLRVAGGWVRDKLLATPEFQTYHKVFDVGSGNSKGSSTSEAATSRLTSKFRTSGGTSMGRQGTKVLVSHKEENQPVDIDIALDDMLGREFADHLNDYLSAHGKDEVTVGMVLKNPEKSKHLETATMKVASFWIDFVNLRAEEYTQDSRIPDLMRIGTAEEDAFRRDLTINALFYNINTGQVEDWTGRGFQDLRKGVIATPLPPLTTLLDDPLRVLRSIRFAARLRFTMDAELVEAAKTASVGKALKEKVSRERVGGELDLMLRSPDPVGAVRLLINLKLVDCVFPVESHFQALVKQQLKRGGAVEIPDDKTNQAAAHLTENVFNRGLHLLTTAHDHLADCRWSPPVWCVNKHSSFGAPEMRLIEDEEARRLLWYAAFLKPLYDDFKIQQAQAKNLPKGRPGSKKAHRCIVSKILVDELKRPGRDAEAIQRIMRGADDFSNLIKSGSAVSATMILLSNVHVAHTTSNGGKEFCDVESEETNCDYGVLTCFMNGRRVDSTMEDDPVWQHAMEFRLEGAKIMRRLGPLWRAALFLSIAEDLVDSENFGDMEYTIEGDVFDDADELVRQGVMERFDAFAAALQQVGVIGIWNEKPIMDGDTVKRALPRLPKGPAFREVMDEQLNWMTMHPGGGADALRNFLCRAFPEYAPEGSVAEDGTKANSNTADGDDGSWL